jgi:hypothetical protein
LYAPWRAQRSAIIVAHHRLPGLPWLRRPPWRLSARQLGPCTFLVWLGLVFLADRRGTKKEDARQADGRLAAVAQPDDAAEDEHSEAGHDRADGRRGAAA